MNVHHPYSQLGCCRDRMGRRVRNIVEFQIQKDIKAALLHITHDLRTKQRKHLFADFQAAVAWVNTINERKRVIAIVIIQGDNNRRFSNCAGRRGSYRRHDRTFSSMGAASAREC